MHGIPHLVRGDSAFDLVDDDVVRAWRLFGPEPSCGAVDARAAAAADDLDAADDLAHRPTFDGGGEQRHLMAARDKRARDLLREHLRASGGAMREVLPVEDQDPHRARRIVSSSCSAMPPTS